MSLENELLNAVAVEQVLSHLDPQSRAVVEILFGISLPEDWPFVGTPTLSMVGMYVGVRYTGVPMTEAGVRWVRNRAMTKLRAGVRDDE